jgi:hypothetical protein
MNADVLFFDFSYEEYLPIIHKAAERGIRPIMNQPPMRQILVEQGGQARAFFEFAEAGDVSAASEQSKGMGRRFATAITSPTAATAFDSEAGNLLLAGGRSMVEKILAMAENQVLIVRIMERLIASTDLRAVVMRSCLSSGQRVLQAVAARHGIPVIELSHGNPAWGADLAPPAYDWHFAVFGERERLAVIALGSDPTLVHATGAAQWDILYTPEARLSKKQARQELGLPLDRPFILYAGGFASGGTLFFADKALMLLDCNEMFAEAVGQLAQKPLVAVRPHPGESRQKPGRPPNTAELADYRKWFADKGVELIHVDYSQASLVRDKASLIRAADVVVVPDASSTLITEVMILDRPVVMVDAGPTPFHKFYTPADGVSWVHDADELRAELSRILESDTYCEELRRLRELALPDLNLNHDGASADRVVDLIEQVMGA